MNYKKPILYADDIDQHFISWLTEEIKVDELKRNKSLSRIIVEDVAPKIPGYIGKLDAKEIADLWDRDIIDSNGELQPMGKGYVACLMADL